MFQLANISELRSRYSGKLTRKQIVVPLAATAGILYWYTAYRVYKKAKSTVDGEGGTNGLVQSFFEAPADQPIPAIPRVGGITAYSQNKWPASTDRNLINIVPVTVGTTKGPHTIYVRGEGASRFRQIASYWQNNIEPIYSIHGHSYRAISGSSTISNHGSGTAIDINAATHPLGVSNTIPAHLVPGLRAEAARLGLRWGGDYKNRKDDMHFEIVSPPQYR